MSVTHSLRQGGEPQIVQVVQQNWLCPNLRFGNKPFRLWWASQRCIRLCGTTIINYSVKGIQGKKHSKVGYLTSIFNAVAAFLGHKSCL